jgi:hypothetical protein
MISHSIHINFPEPQQNVHVQDDVTQGPSTDISPGPSTQQPTQESVSPNSGMYLQS